MNTNDIIIYDFETGSRNPYKTQPIQIAAIALNGRTLKLQDNGSFESLMKPILDDKKAESLGLDPIQDEALAVNKKTREELKDAPSPKSVWESFTEWVNCFNFKKTQWGAPVKAGFNNNKFDDIIVNRLCGADPNYSFGPWDDTYEQDALFHPIHSIDVMKYCWYWFENMRLPIKGMSLDALRQYFGISSEGAHDALVDVYDTAEILVRFLSLSRKIVPKVKFEQACAIERKIKRA